MQQLLPVSFRSVPERSGFSSIPPWIETFAITHIYRFVAHELVDGQRPPTSTSRPPDVIHLIGVPRPSPFFALFRSVYYTERKPKNNKRGRPGNEANKVLDQTQVYILVLLILLSSSSDALESSLRRTLVTAIADTTIVVILVSFVPSILCCFILIIGYSVHSTMYT